jgi:hypothetical protein
LIVISLTLRGGDALSSSPIPDAVIDGGGVLAVALERAVDVSDGDLRMHAVHPVPERGPESHSHRVGVAQPVRSNPMLCPAGPS